MSAQLRKYTLKDKRTGETFYRILLVGTQVTGEGRTEEEALVNLKQNVKKVQTQFLLSTPKVTDKPIKAPRGQLKRCSCRRLSSKKMCVHGNFKLAPGVRNMQMKKYLPDTRQS